jgi:hypothetical protein
LALITGRGRAAICLQREELRRRKLPALNGA